MRAQAAGMTDAEIKAGVEQLRQQGMKIGERVETAITGPGSSTDFGSGATYSSRAVFLPEGSTAGGGKGVVWASGPMTNQQVLNMFAGQPRESYILPAGIQEPGMPYRAPSGTSFVDPTASAAEQARQATAGLSIPMLPAAPAPAAKRPVRFAKAKRQAQRAQARRRGESYLPETSSLASRMPRRQFG
jgi:hypothetical protein